MAWDQGCADLAEDLCGDLCIVQAKVHNCTFAGNSAFDPNEASDGLGGAIALTFSTRATVDNCVFWDNTHEGTQDESEQIYVEPGSEVTVTFSDIMDEQIDGDDPFGGAANGNIDDDPKFLGGPSGDWSALATFDPATGQTTFTDNDAFFGDLVDNFLNPDTAQPLQSLIVSNTPKKITVWGDFHELGENNETYQINDYRLDSPTSPCIDAADNNAVTICSADLDGNERFFDDPATEDTGVNSPEHPFDFVDMGAYEFGGDPELDCDGNHIADSCCPADFDGDGDVDAFDLAQLLGDWGPCPDPCVVGDSTCECRPDFDNNCGVEAFDLGGLLGDWGPCP